MKRLFWVALSVLAYAIACVESFRADAHGLRHTDPPCARCLSMKWERRRVECLRAAARCA